MTVDTTSTPKKKQLIINTITNGTPSLTFGEWRNPKDHSRTANTLDYWVRLAKTAEKGKLHGIFIADHLVYFNTYQGSWKPAASKGIFSPRISPDAAITAMASVTKSLGFGITFSTVSEHPYHFARRLASLDHLTDGRVGWNIVSSYLPDIGRQLLNGAELPPHDERYEKSQEYLDSVYNLLLSSWRDDALEYDKEKGVYANPDHIRDIDFDGKYFKIKGPAITEPSPQRFPVIFQAGTSEKGQLFAAENAESIFLNSGDRAKIAPTIKQIRKLAKEKFGRDPNSIKFLITGSPVLGRTHGEALSKLEELKKYVDPEAAWVTFSGYSGIDVDKFNLDEPVELNSDSNAGRSMAAMLAKRNGKAQTKQQILENGSKVGSLVGTPEEVADILEDWVDNHDVDGFNFGVPVFPGSLDDIVELLIPELQKRGLFHKDYTVPGGTLRENVYHIEGQKYFPQSHPAYPLRWDSTQEKGEFESRLAEYKEERDNTRAKAAAE